MGAAPRGGPARRWAARPARPRRRAPASRSLPAVCSPPPAPAGGVFAPLRAALGRLRLLPAPSSGALARRRSGAASPRLGALRRACARLACRLRLSLGCARAPSRLLRARGLGRSVGARARSGGSPLPRGLVLGAGLLAAAPRAGALAPLRGARGASCLAPARSGFGALRRAAPLRRGSIRRASPSSREIKKMHESEKTCTKLISQFPRAYVILEVGPHASKDTTKLHGDEVRTQGRAAQTGGSLLILILYVIKFGGEPPKKMKNAHFPQAFAVKFSSKNVNLGTKKEKAPCQSRGNVVQ